MHLIKYLLEVHHRQIIDIAGLLNQQKRAVCFIEFAGLNITKFLFSSNIVKEDTVQKSKDQFETRGFVGNMFC